MAQSWMQKTRWVSFQLFKDHSCIQDLLGIFFLTFRYHVQHNLVVLYKRNITLLPQQITEKNWLSCTDYPNNPSVTLKWFFFGTCNDLNCRHLVLLSVMYFKICYCIMTRYQHLHQVCYANHDCPFPYTCTSWIVSHLCRSTAGVVTLWMCIHSSCRILRVIGRG